MIAPGLITGLLAVLLAWLLGQCGSSESQVWAGYSPGYDPWKCRFRRKKPYLLPSDDFNDFGDVSGLRTQFLGSELENSCVGVSKEVDF